MKFRRLLLLVSVILWIFIENYSLQTERTELPFASLPAEFDGFRIVELADLHGRQYGTAHKTLLRAVAACEPDLICLTGDFVERDTALAKMEPLLRGLCKIAPTAYVTGNHEWQRQDLGAWLAHCRALGILVLQNDFVLLRRGDAQLILAGVDDPCGFADQKTPQELVSELPEGFVLMLAHRNDTLPLWAGLGVDAVLTGHAHGGTVRLPFLGGLFGNGGTLFPDYDAGTYREGGTTLYVSRGLSSGRAPLRLGNRPEVSLLILRSVNKS